MLDKRNKGQNLKLVSYNFTLDSTLKSSVAGEEINIPAEGYLLVPGAFVLGRTRETINLNNKFICILGTRSSVAQQGVDVLQSSTIAEPDSNGQFTLEISNNGMQDVILRAGERIVKGIFSRVEEL
mgnify:CR=1 FL=1